MWVFGTYAQTVNATTVSMTASMSNLYMALSNNDTDCLSSADGGKTLKTKIISIPNKYIRWISIHRYPHLEVMYMSLGGQDQEC